MATGIKEIKPSFQVGAQGPGHILRCVHVFPSQSGTEVAPSAVIGGLGVTLRKSGIPVIDRLTDPINRYYQHHYEDVPITNAFSIDFVEDNNVGVNLMPTADATDMVWEIDISDICHLDFYYRMVTTLERL